MAEIRVVFLWHMHQPFYKDLVSGEYRLPWVRMHALKDYFGMVKLLEEFPDAHQTFNLVPSLMIQIQDYASGAARDPFLEVAAKPAAELNDAERQFALQYLFQANPAHLIGRYPRYAELYAQADSPEKKDIAQKRFTAQDLTDLQVLSQLAWFDEFVLEEPEIKELAAKGRDYSLAEQLRVIALEHELIGRVLPEYAAAAKRGAIEISTSPFYHPILPLLCDTNAGKVSAPGITLPSRRFRHPEDAREQLARGIALHEQLFGAPPQGCWPSEGSVSEEMLAIGAQLGLKWMATDQGVLGRTLGTHFSRNGEGRVESEAASRLYRAYRYEKSEPPIHLLFRDHVLSDLIGFVYSGMEEQAAAEDFIQKIKEAAQPLVEQGKDATVSIMLDGENAWEHYSRSGREFLRRLYDGMSKAGIQMVTVSEAIARESESGALKSLVPGSWINADFNVWIGAPEDNRSWDYLSAARDFYSEKAPAADEKQRALAFEEIMIAEGSDWNWWYGPDHHSANDREFDELYRKHLSNVYRALGEPPPDYLAQSIIHAEEVRSHAIPQSSYIHPRIDGDDMRYFDWIGAAAVTADGRDSDMHGKQFVLKRLYAGIDESNLYGKLELEFGAEELLLAVNLESWWPEAVS
ncbi:MAG TPA: glycoside hydrolase family 57 protein, partial [Terriglobales bacterium]|nr:glycoside hydrolase family 57 protein [Terriglobales bacterium]